jgi:hypothetical protein
MVGWTLKPQLMGGSVDSTKILFFESGYFSPVRDLIFVALGKDGNN